MPRLEARFTGPLILFLLAALVFAPGEHSVRQDAITQMDSGDMAAWMLAPTLDQGLAGEERFGRDDPSSQGGGKQGPGRIWVSAPPLGVSHLAATSGYLLGIIATTSPAQGFADPSLRRRGPPRFQPT